MESVAQVAIINCAVDSLQHWNVEHARTVCCSLPLARLGIYENAKPLSLQLLWHAQDMPLLQSCQSCHPQLCTGRPAMHCLVPGTLVVHIRGQTLSSIWRMTGRPACSSSKWRHRIKAEYHSSLMYLRNIWRHFIWQYICPDLVLAAMIYHLLVPQGWTISFAHCVLHVNRQTESTCMELFGNTCPMLCHTSAGRRDHLVALCALRSTHHA